MDTRSRKKGELLQVLTLSRSQYTFQFYSKGCTKDTEGHFIHWCVADDIT